MTLKLHNTRSGKKEEFVPLNDNKVGMYVCGPTVYDDCHVGHARSYVAFDVIRRYLLFLGYDVTHVQNFTDVDDNIINRSAEKGVRPQELAEHYTEEYFRDIDPLGILRADHYPRASRYIKEMQEVVLRLIEKGHAYEVDGSVYFSIETAKDRFGQLRHQSLDEMLNGARVEVDERKRDPKDFALWKAAKPGEISWDSPWGKGRPGWHIECSTMATALLGNTLDIHGGGMDLIFPHHESEILQSECYTGEPFARYWLHNGFLRINEEKMSKSLGNFFTIKEIYERFEPMVLRFFLVYTHYRSPIDFSDAGLEEAERSFERLRVFRERLKGSLKEAVQTDKGDPSPFIALAEEARDAFIKAMDDDFNTRNAIAAIFTMVGEGNRLLDSMKRPYPGEGLNTLMETFDTLTKDILGLRFEARERPAGALTPALVELLIEVRQLARNEKNWALADHIRAKLKEMGIALEDSGEETTWKFVER
ncbi:MAG: cysteine--tRNA ligase [Thermoplasmata archaeon]|nr:cysteine--tRNA ligase [Thermoplasmata archaeon]